MHPVCAARGGGGLGGNLLIPKPPAECVGAARRPRPVALIRVTSAPRLFQVDAFHHQAEPHRHGDGPHDSGQELWADL